MGFYLSTPDGYVYRLRLDSRRTSYNWNADRGDVTELSSTYKRNCCDFLVATIQPVDTITASHPQAGPVTGYMIHADFAASGLPLEQSVVEYRSLPDAVREFYVPVYGEAEDSTIEFDVSDYRPWPGEVSERPALPEHAHWHPGTAWTEVFGFTPYDHILPGALTGFRAACSAAIKASGLELHSFGFRDDAIKFEGRAGTAKLWIIERYDLTATETARRKRQGQDLWRSVHTEVHVGPDEVQGVDLAAAVEAWNDRLAGVLAQIPAPGTPCTHCAGTGYMTGGGA